MTVRDRDDLRLVTRTRLVDLTEAGGQHDETANPLPCTLLDDFDHLTRGHRDHSEVDVVGHVEHRRPCAHARHTVRGGVHRIDRTVEPVRDQVAKHLVTDGAATLSGADHGDRVRREQPRDRPRLRHMLTLMHRLERRVGLEDAHLDFDDAVGELALGCEAGALEDREHLAVLGQHLRGEPGDAVRPSDHCEVLEQHGRDSPALMLVVDGERDLGLTPTRPPVVAGNADEVVAEKGDEGHPVVVVDAREPRDVVLAQPRSGTEEPVVDALVRQPAVEGNQAIGIGGPHRPHVHRAAVGQHDVGFPFGRVVAGAHLIERTDGRAPRTPPHVTRRSSLSSSAVDVDHHAAHELVVPGLALLIPQRREVVEEQRDHTGDREHIEDELAAEPAAEADRAPRSRCRGPGCA